MGIVPGTNWPNWTKYWQLYCIKHILYIQFYIHFCKISINIQFEMISNEHMEQKWCWWRGAWVHRTALWGCILQKRLGTTVLHCKSAMSSVLYEWEIVCQSQIRQCSLHYEAHKCDQSLIGDLWNCRSWQNHHSCSATLSALQKSVKLWGHRFLRRHLCILHKVSLKWFCLSKWSFKKLNVNRHSQNGSSHRLSQTPSPSR